MASTTLNGRPRRTVPIPDSHDSTPTDLPTISLPVGGRNGLQPPTEGKLVPCGLRRSLGKASPQHVVSSRPSNPVCLDRTVERAKEILGGRLGETGMGAREYPLLGDAAWRISAVMNMHRTPRRRISRSMTPEQSLRS